VLRQLLVTPEALETRARALADRIAAACPAARLEVVADRTFAGGGSLPDFALESRVVELRSPLPAAVLAAELRNADPPVLARIRDGALRIDPRTLEPGDEKFVEAALAALLR